MSRVFTLYGKLFGFEVRQYHDSPLRWVRVPFLGYWEIAHFSSWSKPLQDAILVSEKSDE